MTKDVENIIFIRIRPNQTTKRVCPNGNASGLYSESRQAHQTEVYSGFIQSLYTDTGISGYFNLCHILPHPLEFKIHWH
jgi:hypothetical protein